jgi:hypothetical protein
MLLEPSVIVTQACALLAEIESRLLVPDEHVVHLATLLDHGLRSGTVVGALAIRDVACTMACAPTKAGASCAVDRLRTCLTALSALADAGARNSELDAEKHAMRSKCEKQAAEIAKLQSRCDKQATEIARLHAAMESRRVEREEYTSKEAAASERASKLQASVERAESKARAAAAQQRRAEEREASVRAELEACELELAKCAANAEKRAKEEKEKEHECVCSKLGELAVRVWYMSGQSAEPTVHEVSDAENAMSKQLMAVRALTQRLLVDSKQADADAASATACLELAAELVEFASATFTEPVLGSLARKMPAHFLSCVAKTDAAGRRRATRVMRVTLALARQGRDGPAFTLEEHVVLHAVGAIYKKRCSEELMCLCDVVDPMEVLAEWRRESEAGGVEAHNALALVRVGKLVPQAYQIGAKRVHDKMPKDVAYFEKGSFIAQTDGPEDEPESTLARLLAYRATRALAYAK